MSHPDDGVLQELLEGELGPADEAVVRAHLATCANCTTLLEELKATQAEASAIVARLDLDPPLKHPARSTRPGRWLNLRAAGIAASLVLVAGTSWLLLQRTRPEQLSAFKDTAPEPAAVKVAPAPAPDRVAPSPPREEFRAGQAAAPPKDAAEVEEEKSVADAAPATQADSPRKQLKAEAVVTAANAAPGPLTLADAEARVGWKVRTIEGLSPRSVDLVQAAPDVAPEVQQRYEVNGVPVILVQQADAPESAISIRGRRADEGIAQGAAAEPAAPPAGIVHPRAAAAAKAPGAVAPVREWKSEGMTFRLSGALPADSLDALMKRVR